MGRQDVIEDFQNFPSKPVFSQVSNDFNRFSEIADWTWSVSGHSAPSILSVTADLAAQGVIALGSGSGTDNAYVAGQRKGEAVRLNGLGKTHEWLWVVKLSDATQMDALAGVYITNTNPINTAISDGLGFRKDDGDTNWDIWMAKDAATAPDDYSQQLAVATATTGWVVLGMRVVTDPATLGKGTVTFFIDGALVGAPMVTLNLPHDEELTQSVAMQNGEAVAKVLYLDLASQKLERAA